MKRFRRLMQDLWFTVQLYRVIRAEVLSKTALHPFHYMGDHILLAELALAGRFLEVPEILFYRRIHRQQTSSAASARHRVRLVSPYPVAKRISWWHLLLIHPTRLKLHLESVARAPLTSYERLRCYLAITEATGRWALARGGRVGSRILRR